MAINLNQAGYYKARNSAVGILWAADSGEVDVSTITDASTALPSAFYDCGSVSPEGFTISENVSEGDPAYDFAGNVVEVSEATAAPTITFTPFQTFSENTVKILYGEDAYSETDGIVKISGSSTPKNKTLVLDLVIKNYNVRFIYPEASFASLGDQTITADEIAAQEVTYNILTPTGSDAVIRIYEPRA